MSDTPLNPADDLPPAQPAGGPMAWFQKLTMTQIIIACVAVVLLFGCCGIGGCIALISTGGKRDGGQDSRDASGGSSTLKFEANAIHAEYDANEVAADAKYKGKTLEVTGNVKEIGKGVFGGQFVAMTLSKNQFMASVRCEFPKSAEGELSKLSKGQRVTIRGKCEGFTLDTVHLEGCTLVK
jgi:hypothetical protein